MGRPLRVGLYSPYFGSTVGGGEKYLGVTAEAIRDGFPGASVEIVAPVPADRELYESRLQLDLSGIGLVATNQRVTGVHRRLARMRALRPLRNLVVGRQAAAVSAGYDVFLAMVYRVPVASQAPRSAILCQFPSPGETHLADYELVVCQSEYVRHWVGQYWSRDAVVVNPPIDVPAEEPAWPAKTRSILSVGRFVAGGHVKRHDVMVEAFARMCSDGLAGWELHLAGSQHRDRDSLAYLRRVERLAAGLAVHVHPDAAHDELSQLYRRAAIYWHAAGYGAPAGDPAALEHFGMTTAEAMGHGAVPVAIALGGQPEVVADGQDGYLWTSLEQLRDRTRQLVDDAGLRERLGRAARAASHRFSRANFKRRMVEALAPLFEPGGAG